MTVSGSTSPGAGHLVVDVALAPALISEAAVPRARTVYVVVDLIRATTTLCVQLARGCPRVYVAGGVDAARAAARALSSRPLLAGEAGGVAPAGFDYGNSPAEFAALDLRGREMVFATTNGTRALHASGGGAAVLAGSLRNAGAVVRAAVVRAARLMGGAGGAGSAQDTPARLPAAPPTRGGEAEQALAALAREDRSADAAIVVVCAGVGERPAYDDTICAGYLVRRIGRELERSGMPFVLESGARIAAATAVAAEQQGLRAALAESGAAHAITALGLGSDLDWCVEVDICLDVPAVVGYDARLDLLIVEPLAQDM